jgi:hypothetical protein
MLIRHRALDHSAVNRAEQSGIAASTWMPTVPRNLSAGQPRIRRLELCRSGAALCRHLKDLRVRDTLACWLLREMRRTSFAKLAAIYSIPSRLCENDHLRNCLAERWASTCLKTIDDLLNAHR